jgi:hypothetical protein
MTMSNIDYRARPAKTVVRRMIVECCRRLRGITKLSNYQYIGFGGLEFLDFDLFHRTLGMCRMISIEKSDRTDRYDFNRPFAAIEMRYGQASDVLPLLDWTGLKIVWLDYEKSLTREALRDCENVSRYLKQGSVLIVTLNAAAPYGERLEALQKRLGTLVPIETVEEDLEGWGYAHVQYRILSEALTAIANDRNDKPRLRQLMNFCYRDGARIQTVAWIISSEALDGTIDACGFNELDFFRPGPDPMVIDLPILTSREIDHLNQQLPLAGRKKLKGDWLYPDERKRFAELYRWYPAQ